VQTNRTAYVRAKVRAEFDANRALDGEEAAAALRLGGAQLDNVKALAAHLTKVFADERVHARV
jgi:hypothetical protein